jgi:hyaluronan synthase
VTWRSIHILWTITFLLAVVGSVATGYIYRANIFTFGGLYAMTPYGLYTLTHFGLQIYFAMLARKQWRDIDPEFQPNVGIMITGYWENLDYFRQCLESIRDQTYLNIVRVVFTEDDDNPASGMDNVFQQVLGMFSHCVHVKGPNSGKRTAMHRGLGEFDDSVDIVTLTDSDTRFDPEAVVRLIQPFKDSRVGATTGYVSVLNWDVNIITLLTNYRYFLAFFLERAAQSYFGVMTCVSGPLGAYRWELIKDIKDEWATQTFLGRPCHFGDDRRFTGMILALGYRVVFVALAWAQTEAPDNIRRLVIQQTRWSRSFYREFILNLSWAGKRHPWMLFDLIYQATFPFFVATNVIIIGIGVTSGRWELFAAWISVLLLFSFARAVIGMALTGDRKFLLFTLYGPLVYVPIILAVKVVAIATLWKQGWGTTPRGLFEENKRS